MAPPIGTLASGEEVVDRTESHIHPGATLDLLREALSRISSYGEERLKTTIDFQRVIGNTHCVRTGPEDDICYAQRVGREGLSRFVKNRRPEPTSRLTVKLHRKTDDTYELRTAYLGGAGTLEPWAARLKGDPNREQEAYAFWKDRALCWGFEDIVSESEVNDGGAF